MRSDKVRHEKYKMVVTVDIDTERLIDILGNAALVVFACLMLVAYIVPLFGESISATLPEFDYDCVVSPEASDLPCPPVPSAVDDQTFPLERPSWKP